MRSHHVAAVIGVALAAAACTSVVQGHGRGVASRSSSVGPTSTGPTSTSPTSSASTSASTSVSTTPPPSDIARASADTAVGDPVTADFCTAIGLDSLRGVGTGLTPSFDTQQYPPGCSVALRDGTKPVAEVNLFADDGQPPTVSGRKTRVVSGLTVYVLPYDPTLGACERDVMATGIRLVVDAYGPGSATPPRRVSCAATDAMTNRLAEVVAAGTVPRLPVANPSLAALDGCKIVRKAGIAELGVFAGSEVIPRGFGVNCELKRTDLFLFFNFVIAESAQPGGTPETVEGHRLIRTDAADTHCSYVSPQGTTADGRHEQLTVTSTFIGATAPVDDLCAQTGQVLARYLTAARLR